MARPDSIGSLAQPRWYQLIPFQRTHLLALSALLALTTTVGAVVADAPTPEDPGNPELISAPAEPTTTTPGSAVIPDAIRVLVLSAPQVQLSEEATASTSTSTSTTTSSSTSTSTSTTSTTVAPKPPSKPQPNPPSPTTTAQQPAATPGAEFRSDYEAEFRSRINSLRSAKGLAGLSSNGSLNARARDWAKRMATNGGLSHSNIGSLVPPWSTAGENVGKGGSVGSIFNSLAASAGHYQSMLGGFTHVGVGVWVDESGVLWTAHVFAG